MSEYRYILENGSKKHQCPECNKRRFVRYVDIETGDYLLDQYGRCDRESNCGYYLNPYLDGYAKNQSQQHGNDWKPRQWRRPVKPKNSTAYIPFEVFDRTRSGYKQNVFIQNLLSRVAYPFEVEDVEKVVSLYHLGTIQNGYRKGATCFPFIDRSSNVRALQVKQFDEMNHTTGTDWLHSIIEKHHVRNNTPLPDWLKAYKANDKIVSCLFGEHLLKLYPYSHVVLVEAPKTAIYGTLYFGKSNRLGGLVWLAVYNLSSLTIDKCKVLEGRDVYLFPDLSKDGKAFELWSRKAKEIESQLNNTRFQVSDLLEQLAPQQDKEKGLDLADYLIKQDWRLFREQQASTPPPEPLPVDTSAREKSEKYEALKTNYFFTEPIEVKEPEPVKSWSNEIEELESYFSKVQLPTEPVQLSNCSTIKNVSGFIYGHIKTIKSNEGKKAFLPYLHRLQQLKTVLTTKEN